MGFQEGTQTDVNVLSTFGSKNVNVIALTDMFYSLLYYFILHSFILLRSSQNFTKDQLIIVYLYTVFLNVFFRVLSLKRT